MSTWNDSYLTDEYLKHWDYRHPSQELVGVVAAGVIPEQGVTLDIGCGAGREAIFLAQCGFRSIGVDLSPAALVIAEQRSLAAGVTVDWREGNALALPVENASIDFINDRGCFHHITDADRPTFANEVARVLKKGGVFFLRGCREESDEEFVLVNESAVRKYFSAEVFDVGRVLPISLISDAGSLKSNVVVVRRR